MRDQHGQCTVTPVSDTLSAQGFLDTRATTKMVKVEEMGFPTARSKFIDGDGRKRISKKDDRIWRLKCSPSCWRLYFYVQEASKRIVYVHAVCKQQDAEDSQDKITARRIADGISPTGGGSRITAFTFEDD